MDMSATISKVGVKYDKSLLESDENMRMIHRDFKALRGKTTKQVLQDHKDLRKIGPDYESRDVGGKREMIKDILSHSHGPNNVKTYKEMKANIRRQMDESSYGSDRAGEFAWQNQRTERSKLSASRGHRLIDKKTNKTISTHKTISDAIAARKKLRGSSDTHSIQSIQEVHKNPDYDLEREIMGYGNLKKKLAQATGIANYGDQEPNEPIALVDLDNHLVKSVNNSKVGHSYKDMKDHIRKMKTLKHTE
jgi:hypothetical protein